MISIFAGVGDTPYNVMLLLHILTAMAAFAPAFTYAVVEAQLGSEDASIKSWAYAKFARNGRMVNSPALLISGLLGFGVAGLSDKVYSMSQGWLIAAFIVWIAMNGVVHAVLLPGERALADGDTSAQGKVNLAGGLTGVLLLIQLVLMIWKPGL